jgi:glutathione S-transferase
MLRPELHVISLRYSSWSIRALLPLLHANADFVLRTVTIDMARQGDPLPEMDGDAFVTAHRKQLATRREFGSVNGLFPVLSVGDTSIHEALAINEWTAETYPEAQLWPTDGLSRARARALSCEMASGFSNLRGKMSCNVFARVQGFRPDGPTRVEIERVHELLRESLQRSGGPFTFGQFGIVDAMYFPVLTRFVTYGVPLPADLEAYDSAIERQPAVVQWRKLAAQAPTIPIYDDYVRKLGGELQVDASRAT